MGDHFDSYVGQTETIDNIREYYEDYQSTGYFPHTLFCWPYGTGKTEIARRTAKLIDPTWSIHSGELNAGDVDMTGWYAFWSNLPFNVALIDEISDASLPMQKSLRSLMLNGIVRTNYTNARMSRETQNVIVLGAGTSKSAIHEHVRSRFGFSPSFSPYTDDELSRIFHLMAGNTKIPDDLVATLIRTSLGEPRQIGHLVRAVKSVIRRGPPTLEAVLQKAGRTDDGMDKDAVQLLVTLGKINDGVGRAGLDVLASVMSFEEKDIKQIERVLVKLRYISRTGRGRVLTDFGWARLRSMGLERGIDEDDGLVW